MLGGVGAEEYLSPVSDARSARLRTQSRNRLMFPLPAAVEYVRSEMCNAGFDSAHVAGHSVGGAVAVLLARRYPKMVRSLINIEGNFTLKDAFWSKKMAEMEPAEARAVLESYQADPSGWLSRNGIEPTAERSRLPPGGLPPQPTSTVQAMARSVVEITAHPEYLEDVRRVLDHGTPIHLVAGERSRDGWDVPEFRSARAASLTIQPNVGHMMMLENAAEFFRIIARLVPSELKPGPTRFAFRPRMREAGRFPPLRRLFHAAREFSITIIVSTARRQPLFQPLHTGARGPECHVRVHRPRSQSYAIVR